MTQAQLIVELDRAAWDLIPGNDGFSATKRKYFKKGSDWRGQRPDPEKEATKALLQQLKKSFLW